MPVNPVPTIAIAKIEITSNGKAGISSTTLLGALVEVGVGVCESVVLGVVDVVGDVAGGTVGARVRVGTGVGALVGVGTGVGVGDGDGWGVPIGCPMVIKG